MIPTPIDHITQFLKVKMMTRRSESGLFQLSGSDPKASSFALLVVADFGNTVSDQVESYPTKLFLMLLNKAIFR